MTRYRPDVAAESARLARLDEDQVLTNEAALDPADDSLHARIVRQVADDIRDHRRPPGCRQD